MGDGVRRCAVLFHSDRDGAPHADDVVKTGIAAGDGGILRVVAAPLALGPDRGAARAAVLANGSQRRSQTLVDAGVARELFQELA